MRDGLVSIKGTVEEDCGATSGAKCFTWTSTDRMRRGWRTTKITHESMVVSRVTSEHVVELKRGKQYRIGFFISDAASCTQYVESRHPSGIANGTVACDALQFECMSWQMFQNSRWIGWITKEHNQGVYIWRDLFGWYPLCRLLV